MHEGWGTQKAKAKAQQGGAWRHCVGVGAADYW